jgi:hypothetical protein
MPADPFTGNQVDVLGLTMDLQAAWERGDDLQRKLDAAHTVLRDRDAELLKLKGPCRWAKDGCRLHWAHSGPCNIHPRSS